MTYPILNETSMENLHPELHNDVLAGITGVQYVHPDGDNSAPGGSWGSAKKDVVSAYDALPASGGQIYVSSGAYIDSVNTTRGLWLMGTSDPNYNGGSMPAGWRLAKRLVLTGVNTNAHHAGARFPQALLNGGDQNDRLKPAIWISNMTSPVRFEHLHLGYQNTAIRLGYFSDLTFTSSSAMVSMATFNNVGAASSGKLGGGPCVDIGYIIWCYWKDCSFDANNYAHTVTAASITAGTTARFTIGTHYLVAGDVVHVSGMTPSGYNGTWTVSAVAATTFDADIGTSPGAATVMGTAIPTIHFRRGPFAHDAATTSAINSGLFTIENTVTYGGGIYYKPNPGAGLFGGVRVLEMTQEGDGTANPQPPLFHLVKRYTDTGVGGTSYGVYLETCGQADGNFPWGAIKVDGDVYDGLVSIGTTTQGPAFVIPGNPGVSDRRRQTGFKSRRLYAEWDGLGRSFPPATARYKNWMPHDPASWGGGGGATLTTGQPDPIGGTLAGNIYKASGEDEYWVKSVSVGAIGIGDWFIAGMWRRLVTSTTARSNIGFVDANYKFENGVGNGTGGNVMWFGTGGFTDGAWEFITGCGKIGAVGGGATNVVESLRTTNGSTDYYAPFLYHIPAASAPPDNEVIQYARYLQSVPDTAPAGAVTTMRGQKLIAWGGLGVGNDAAASGPVGTVVKKIEVFDETGASLGYLPVYNTIT